MTEALLFFVPVLPCGMYYVLLLLYNRWRLDAEPDETYLFIDTTIGLLLLL